MSTNAILGLSRMHTGNVSFLGSFQKPVEGKVASQHTWHVTLYMLDCAGKSVFCSGHDDHVHGRRQSNDQIITLRSVLIFLNVGLLSYG